MLTLLRITNFALIERLELELGPGLTVLTGETGAGKSIILAAVNLLLGGRAAADLIRAGADQAVVEALFDLAPEAPAAARLAEAGLSPEPGEELLLRRTVSREGRNRVVVAGAMSTLGLLAELGPELVSLVGQHASQALLRPEEHLDLLDAFAGLEDARQAVAAAVGRVQALDRAIADQTERLARREERRAWLGQVIAEIEAANLDPDEEEALKAERKALANAEQLARLAQNAHQGLYAADENPVLEVLGRVRGLVADLARLDERAAPLAQRLEEAYYGLEDLARELDDYARRVVLDPARLDWVEGRLLAIQRLARKHGGGVEAALAALADARRELAELTGGEERLAELVRQREAGLAEALDLARALSAGRRQAAPRLAAAAANELKDLGLPHCAFETRLQPPTGQALATPAGPLARGGLETAEFHIAPNPGEGFRRLARVASGGELSRLLLALKTLVAQRAGAPTLVFDEVDAGIGGAVGAAVGRKLALLARQAQVLVITHLPQIAAWADRHWTVGKRVREGRTITVIEALDEAGRVEELARMLAGLDDLASARQHARELIAAARRARPG
ncbi:MAG: DNA repair protein RecN [Thermodesulfobacteriota bacterium]